MNALVLIYGLTLRWLVVIPALERHVLSRRALRIMRSSLYGVLVARARS